MESGQLWAYQVALGGQACLTWLSQSPSPEHMPQFTCSLLSFSLGPQKRALRQPCNWRVTLNPTKVGRLYCRPQLDTEGGGSHSIPSVSRTWPSSLELPNGSQTLKFPKPTHTRFPHLQLSLSSVRSRDLVLRCVHLCEPFSSCSRRASPAYSALSQAVQRQAPSGKWRLSEDETHLVPAECTLGNKSRCVEGWVRPARGGGTESSQLGIWATSAGSKQSWCPQAGLRGPLGLCSRCQSRKVIALVRKEGRGRWGEWKRGRREGGWMHTSTTIQTSPGSWTPPWQP